MKGPNFDIAFSVGKFNIYWYAILLAVGIAAAMLITDRRAKGRQVPKEISLDLCILGLPFGVLGGRLFTCLSGAVAWGSFFDLTKSGLSFFGAVIFATAAILVYLKHRKVKVGEMLDIAAPGVFAGIGIAVWGDFFNRTNYGPLVQKASLKWFPLATFGSDLKVHYAAFFYEFLLCVALIVLYYALLRKKVAKKANRFLLMTLVYCLGRFCIDSIRQGLVKAGPLAFDQIWEIVIAVLCLALLLLKRQPEAEVQEETEQPEQAAEEVVQTPAEPEEPVEAEVKDGEAPAAEEAQEAAIPEPEVIAAPESEEPTFSGLN